jgi:hypothetical protein
VRPNNLAYKGYGDSSDARWYLNHLDTGIRLTDFDMSMEFLATGLNFDAVYAIGNNDYEFVFRLYHNLGHAPQNISLIVYASGIDDNRSLIPADPFNLNTWYRLHSWYNAETTSIITELRDIETNTLFGEVSILLDTVRIQQTIDWTSWGVRDTPWQYVDNVVLTPEPTTILLLGLGTFMLRKRKT